MPAIHFEAKVVKIGSYTLVRLPQSASDKLPSRGMVMVEGTINDFGFQDALEPDGKKGHWLRIDTGLLKHVGAQVGDTVVLAIEPSKEWPEPAVPTDLAQALAADQQARNVWTDITPASRWDWIRWINATKNPVTRQRRIDVMCSKLNSDKRRPCCFNRTECSDPSVSKGGILLELA